MTDAAELLAQLEPLPVVAILRAGSADGFLAAGRVLHECGVGLLEVTLTSAGALEALHELRRHLPAAVVLGVGSVRTPRQAEEAAAAGAGFLVSPVFLDWMPAAAPPGVPLLPGALTPTEVVRAWESGAVAAVKLFPAGASGGAAYVAQVVAPLPDVPLLPTGGIELEEVPRYLGAGAVGVGLGGPLLGDALRPGGDLEALRRRAEGLVSSLRP